MEATELRIGNWFRQTVGVVSPPNYEKHEYQWTLNHFTYLENGSKGFSLEHVEGIPITDEWLLKLGFVKNGRDFIKIWDDIEEFLIFDYGSVNGGDKGFVTNNDFSIKRLQFIHQLQNRYLDSTGEELQITTSKEV